MKWLLPLLFAGSLAAAGGPRLFFSRNFPGSAPPYIQVTVDADGSVEYGEAPDDDNPLKFRLTDSETREVFGLADKLDHFKRPLESPLKVAFMGTKTFRFEDGAQHNEVKFNYSEDPDARLLTDWFERIADSERHVIDLERAVKYDRLGVLNALLSLETDWDRKRLVCPQQFLPLLDRVVKNESYMHTARVRAAALAEAMRAAK